MITGKAGFFSSTLVRPEARPAPVDQEPGMAADMTIRTSDFLAPVPTKRLRFDDYVLDLDRFCLLLHGAEIALRPKTLAVLHFLAKNPGRLVSKAELFAAVWPNMAITDDVLVQSIGELRRALRDSGPRLIRTVPRCGYRFEADVLADELSGRSCRRSSSDSGCA